MKLREKECCKHYMCTDLPALLQLLFTKFREMKKLLIY